MYRRNLKDLPGRGYILKNYFNVIPDCFFPVRCPACGRVVKGGERLICRECRGIFAGTGSNVCRRCGKPVGEEQDLCGDCKIKEHVFKRNFAMWIYNEDMQKSIADFKYHDRPEYAGFYAEEMVKRFKGEILSLKIEAIVPVPLYLGKKKLRGYNQAEVLAEKLGKGLEIPVYKNLILRVKKTLPQKELDNIERSRNLKGAFVWNKKWMEKQKGEERIKSLLLVDDIYTTGSTMDECSRVLMENGVERVYGITVSIGSGAVVK